jgi:hypothetical protein
VTAEPQELPAARFARWWKETGERELCQVLFWRWDPLGVSDYFPNTADEYDGYAPGVVALLRLGVAPDVLADHLDFLEREPMGLPPRDGTQRTEVAELLGAWFVNSIDAWAQHGPR